MRLPMMRLWVAVALVFSAVLAVPTTAAAAEPLDFTVDELITIDRALDGSMVRFAGEAIGEDLHADGDHRWINLLGNTMAVGVYVDNANAEKISVYGDHTHQGGTVEVVGILNIACDEHAGEFDVHAVSFDVVSKGSDIERPFEPWKGIAALVLFVVAAIEFRFLGHLRERILK